MKKLTNLEYFSNKLLLWHKNDNKRSMPWKEERNPYRIWLSEIIMQQTKVEQGLNYYNKFIIKYPNVTKLANANEKSVFKLWEGLGYYSRCKNLIITAKFIASKLNGNFPNSYDEILKLKGIGPYTAAAISSFAFNLPHAVVDGNVLRVLARYFAIHIEIDSSKGKKYFDTLAQSLLDKVSPALYNQAIMDFGATICKPKKPLCNCCILQKKCLAFANLETQILPLKGKKLIKKKRYFYYLIANFENKYYVKKRTEKDIWQNLWEFIAFEFPQIMGIDDFLNSSDFVEKITQDYLLKDVSALNTQILTHQNINCIFVHIDLNTALKNIEYSLVSKKEMNELAFPRIITNYFEQTKIQ